MPPAKKKQATAAAKGGKPLAGAVVCITGTLSEPRAQIKAQIEALGGKVAGSMTKAVTHLLAAPEEKYTAKAMQAASAGVPVVDEDWLRAMQAGKQAAPKVADQSAKKPIFAPFAFALTPAAVQANGQLAQLIEQHGGAVVKPDHIRTTHVVHCRDAPLPPDFPPDVLLTIPVLDHRFIDESAAKQKCENPSAYLIPAAQLGDQLQSSSIQSSSSKPKAKAKAKSSSSSSSSSSIVESAKVSVDASLVRELVAHFRESYPKDVTGLALVAKLAAALTPAGPSWYFASLMPDESGDSYDDDDETVDYSVIVSPLADLHGTPLSLLDWFREMYKHPASERENFVVQSLKLPSILAAHMIWTTFDHDGGENPSQFDSEDQLMTWLGRRLLAERYTSVSDKVCVGSTSEFDVEYVFFKADAVASGGLGHYIGPLVTIDADTKQPRAVQPVWRGSAYL